MTQGANDSATPGTVPDGTLDAIVHTIVERLHPDRIILFGSRARGDARPGSDYDLMVEVDRRQCPVEPSGELQRIVDETSPRAELDIVARDRGEIESRCDDPGRVEWDIAREGVLLHPASGALAVERPRRARVSELPPSVHDWLALAADDLDAVDAMLAPEHVPWASVCFHAQQAAEKYLKVLLIARGVRPPRTHQLSTLVRIAREAHYELPDLDAECAVLQPFAVAVRYADRMPIPDERTGRAAVEAGRRVVDAARRVLAR